MIWIEFLICSALLTFFAYHLCREGIIISEKTHLEEGIIGMFFLAVATSFPEIVTGATAVFFLDKTALGYGDVIGSIIFNLMLLVGLDLYQGEGRILLRVSGINRLTGVYTLFLLGIVLLGAVLRTMGVGIPSFFGVGIENILIICTYFLALNIIRKSGEGKGEAPFEADKESFALIWVKFIVLLAVVMALGVWMAKIGDKIVVRTAMSQTFIGTLFLGIATSLPEIIVSFAALRMGSIDMAVGNILGSNLFDVCIIPLLDALSRRPILGFMTSAQLTATVIVTILALITVIGLFSKRDTKGKMGWDTVLIFAVGSLGFVLLYYLR